MIELMKNPCVPDCEGYEATKLWFPETTIESCVCCEKSIYQAQLSTLKWVVGQITETVEANKDKMSTETISWFVALTQALKEEVN